MSLKKKVDGQVHSQESQAPGYHLKNEKWSQHGTIGVGAFLLTVGKPSNPGQGQHQLGNEGKAHARSGVHLGDDCLHITGDNQADSEDGESDAN
jgi:hypothetical protein